jgi:hypothetical protein
MIQNHETSDPNSNEMKQGGPSILLRPREVIDMPEYDDSRSDGTRGSPFTDAAVRVSVLHSHNSVFMVLMFGHFFYALVMVA